MMRLSWRTSSAELTDWDRIARSLSAERDLAVFCDNSAFDDSVPREFWEKLLSEPGRLVIIDRVDTELRPWLERRPDHAVARARKEHSSGLGEWHEPGVGEPRRRAFDYYVGLLSLRRRALVLAAADFRREHGRDPEPAKRSPLADWVQRKFGERGRLLATKPAGAQTDEALVYLAVEHAITTGRQTLILTRDADVEEQFFKLLWLIDSHYRAMLLADDYVENFGTRRTLAVDPTLLDDPDGPFVPPDAVLVERDEDLCDVLPAHPHCVGIACWTMRLKGTQLSFMAETEMAHVLAIKDRTGGLSTDRLGGRDLHVWTYPFEVNGRRDCAVIAYDRRHPLGTTDMCVAVLDIYHALMPCERHKRVIPKSESAGSALWTPSNPRTLAFKWRRGHPGRHRH
jgi:hypothetical protein